MKGRIRSLAEGEGVIETFCGPAFPFRADALAKCETFAAGNFVEFETDGIGRAIKIERMKSDDASAVWPAIAVSALL